MEWPKQLVGTLAAAPTPPITIILDRSHYISLISPALCLALNQCLMFLILSFVCHKELAETGLYGVILWFEGGSAIRGHRHNHHLP